jgi:predicted Rossmann-fold nucleotide-binding protein
MAAETQAQWAAMSQEELAELLEDAAVIFHTGAMEKYTSYRRAFTLLEGADNSEAGVNFHLCHSREVNIIPSKTAEETGTTAGNGLEKAYAQMLELAANLDNIRQSFPQKREDNYQTVDPQTANIVGITEDSGVRFFVRDEHGNEDNHKTQAFNAAIMQRIWRMPISDKQKEKIKQGIEQHGFPSAELKPMQELLGGFGKLMQMVYEVAAEAGVETLAYENQSALTFVDPAKSRYFQKQDFSYGVLLTKEQYEARVNQVSGGVAIDTDFVMIPDRQYNGDRKTISELDREIYVKNSSKLHADYFRRKHAEWLQGVVGARKIIQPNKKPVNIAFTNADWYENGQDSESKKIAANTLANINDLKTVYIPTRDNLRHYPSISQFGEASIIVVNASGWSDEKKREMGHDPDYSYLCNLLVTEEVDAQNMGKTIIVDNRCAGFNGCLDLLSDLSLEGRRIGNFSFKIANTDEELEKYTREAKDIYQRSPLTTYQDVMIEQENRIITDEKEDILWKSDPNSIKKHKWRSIPDDDVPTLLVCGGHSNNNPKDLQEAHDYGYHCAKNGWRIVTGGGVLEGSMGATHTGFVQYHLDQLNANFHQNAEKYQELSSETQNALQQCREGDKISAEKLIKKHRAAIEELAEKRFIDRDMFWSYTTEALAKLEGDGELAAGTTSFFTPNRVIRIDELVKPDTKIIMPGSFGTDEEFEAILEDHYHKRKAREAEGINDTATAIQKPQTLVIYNPDGRYDSLLDHHGIGGGMQSSLRRERYGIIECKTMEELAQVTNTRQQAVKKSWAARTQGGDTSERSIA